MGVESVKKQIEVLYGEKCSQIITCDESYSFVLESFRLVIYFVDTGSCTEAYKIKEKLSINSNYIIVSLGVKDVIMSFKTGKTVDTVLNSKSIERVTLDSDVFYIRDHTDMYYMLNLSNGRQVKSKNYNFINSPDTNLSYWSADHIHKKEYKNNYEYLVTCNEGKYGTIGFNGEEILGNVYDNIYYNHRIGMVFAFKDGINHVINKKGELLFDDIYKTEILHNQIIKLQRHKVVTIMYRNRIVYENSVPFVLSLLNGMFLKVALCGSEHRVGGVDLFNNTKIDEIYENIEHFITSDQTKNYYLVRKNGLYGTIDTEGKVHLKTIYNKITYNGNAGYIIAVKGNKHIVYEVSGKVAYENDDVIDIYCTGMVGFHEKGKIKLVYGKKVIAIFNCSITCKKLMNSLIVVQYNKGGYPKGVINTSGKLVIPVVYNKIYKQQGRSDTIVCIRENKTDYYNILNGKVLNPVNLDMYSKHDLTEEEESLNKKMYKYDKGYNM